MSINNGSLATFQTLISNNFPMFLNSLSPNSVQLMILAVGSTFVTDILSPAQIQSIIILLPLQQLRNICASFIPQSDYRTQGTLLTMNLTDLQNFIQTLSQTQIIDMVQKIILLPIDEYKNIIKNIPATKLQALILSLSTNQQSTFQKKLLLTSFEQLYPLLQSMQLFETYDSMIGVC